MTSASLSALYQKLKKDQIRVLHVKYDDGELSGTLEITTLPRSAGPMTLISKVHQQLQEEQKPGKRWAALSYVWGDPTLIKTFTLNGVKTLIHLNLYQALRNFCLSNSNQHIETHPLWTDYVCINQADLEERKRHIHSMDQIYQNAYGVYSYFGDSNEYTQTAVNFLTRLQPIIQSGIDDFVAQCASDGVPRWIGDAPFMRDNLPPPEQRPGVADEIRSIFFNTYFDRIWILQENVLAQHQNVLRGSVPIDGELLYEYSKRAFWRQSILTTFFPNPPADLNIMRGIFNPWPYIRTMCEPDDGEEEGTSSRRHWPEPRSPVKRSISRLLSTNSQIDARYAERFRGKDSLWYAEDPENPAYALFEGLLHFSFELDCTMPEDRCLSLIGLLKWGVRRKIGRSSHLLEKLPDTLDAKSVYLSFAITMLQGRNGLVVLSWALYSGRQADYDLPTWCPNFHHMSGCWIKNIYYRYAPQLLAFHLEELPRISYHEPEHALTCHGVRVDTIQRCMKRTWKKNGGEQLESIGCEVELELLEAKINAAFSFLKQVWEHFQEAVQLSPRVKDSYRSKIQHCDMQDAGMGFLSNMMRLEDEPDLSKEIDLSAALEYLQRLRTVIRESGIEIHKVLADEKKKADGIIERLGRFEDQHFFVTQQGYFGSGTAEVQPGDILVMLAGAKYPFILDPADTSAGKNRWQLVAEVYVSELASCGTYINELDPASFWPTSFRATELRLESEEQGSQERDEIEGKVKREVGDGTTGKSSTTNNKSAEVENDSSPYAMPEPNILRWRVDNTFESEKVTIEGHTFIVSAFQGEHENFTLI